MTSLLKYSGVHPQMTHVQCHRVFIREGLFFVCAVRFFSPTTYAKCVGIPKD